MCESPTQGFSCATCRQPAPAGGLGGCDSERDRIRWPSSGPPPEAQSHCGAHRAQPAAAPMAPRCGAAALRRRFMTRDCSWESNGRIFQTSQLFLAGKSFFCVGKFIFLTCLHGFFSCAQAISLCRKVISEARKYTFCTQENGL